MVSSKGGHRSLDFSSRAIPHIKLINFSMVRQRKCVAIAFEAHATYKTILKHETKVKNEWEILFSCVA